MVRLLLALVVGGATGCGCCLLALGLLPNFPPVSNPVQVDKRVDGDDEAIVRSILMDPHVQAEKRRFATAIGIGCVVGGIVSLAVFRRTRSWVEVVSKPS
jgi:hypothetical protein